jgi:antitoxin HicB
MKQKKIAKTEMAKKMQTSRSQLDRLLDPEKTGVSIDRIQRVASVVGRQLRIELKIGSHYWKSWRSPFLPLLQAAIRKEYEKQMSIRHSVFWHK